MKKILILFLIIGLFFPSISSVLAARGFATASSQYLTASAVLTAVPISMACWYITNGVAFQNLINLGVSGSNDNRFSLLLTDSVKTVVRAQTRTTTNAIADTTATYSTGVWQHAAAVFTSAASRDVYLNGGNSANNTGNRTPAGVNETSLAVNSTLTESFLDGQLAECGIWNAALTAAEVASLADGVTPLQIRPNNLVFYAPLVRGDRDLVGGLTITAVNSPTVTAHTRVFRTR